MKRQAGLLKAPIFADRLQETFGIEPYALPDGTLGIHYMELSHSTETGFTLLAAIDEDIDDYREGGEEAGRHLRRWLETLRAGIAAIELTLGEAKEASCQQGKPCGDPDSCPDPIGCDFRDHKPAPRSKRGGLNLC